MDTFENNEQYPELENSQPMVPVEEPIIEESIAEDFIAEDPISPQYASEPDPTAYRGAGTGRKESPYANSPYVMQHQPRNERYYQYQPQSEVPKKQPKKRKTGFWKRAVAVLLIVAVAAASSCITAAMVNSSWNERMYQTEKYFSDQIDDLQQQIDSISGRSSGNSVSGSPTATGDSLTPSQVYAQNVGSVVAISTVIQSDYYGQVTEGTSSGSGFILTADGYVVTNYHVVEGASSVSVITHDSTEHAAQIVGYDSTNDIAVLKVEAEGLPAVALGSSRDLIIGDMVVAIGNPLGELTSTQTVGYVSGIGREVSTDGLTTISMIQTDAAINPGNSGGPLFNMKGEVVGITTAKYSGTTTSGASIEGIGFAIPIDDVLSMISDLMDYGYVTGAYLGVSVRNMDPAVTSMYGLPDGAQVVELVAGASADRAGVQINDIIIDLGGYEVTNVTTLTRALRNFKAGDTTTVTVVRSGIEKVLTITLDEKPRDMTTTTVPEEDASMPSEGNYEEWFHFFFGDQP